MGDEKGLPVLKSCRCDQAQRVEPHTCPFASEINDDDTTLCTCCAECQYGCAMDI